MPKDRRGAKWDIHSYAKYVSLRYPELKVPTNQEWVTVDTKLIHTCEKHGSSLSKPNAILLLFQTGNQCIGCQTDYNKSLKREFKHASASDKIKAAEMFANGVLKKDIAKEFNVASSTVTRWLSKKARDNNNKYSSKWKKENTSRNLEIYREFGGKT